MPETKRTIRLAVVVAGSGAVVALGNGTEVFGSVVASEVELDLAHAKRIRAEQTCQNPLQSSPVDS